MMQINVFSILMTIWWSSILIILFYFLRTRTKLLHVCSISTIIFLYLFCAVRIALPIELPWSYVVPWRKVYNKIHDLLYYKIGSVRVYELFTVIWIIGSLCILLKYLVSYFKAIVYIRNIPRIKCDIDESRCDRRIEIIKTAYVKAPCSFGILSPKILLPDREYGNDELQYILMHEYTHIRSHDILIKQLIAVLCGIYWWNPIVYLLKKDLDQSLEIRCDLSIVNHLSENERADYLTVMLKAFRESRQINKYVGMAGLIENHSDSILERFQIVADMGVVQKNHANMFVGMLMLLVLVLSYSFVFRSSFEVPQSEIVTDSNTFEITPENTYIIKQGEEYIVHAKDKQTVISKEIAMMMAGDGFEVREDK